MKSSESIDTLAKALLKRHKCIDVLVNCAGIFPMTGQTPLEGVLTLELHCKEYVCTCDASTDLSPKCALLMSAHLEHH